MILENQPAVPAADALSRYANPMMVALVTLTFCLVLHAGILLSEWQKWISSVSQTHWIISGAFMLVFIIFNAILGVLATDFKKYWLQSFYSFAALTTVATLLAWAFSGVGLSDSDGFGWIYFVLVFCFILFTGIIATMRFIWEFFDEEGKQQLRKKK